MSKKGIVIFSVVTTILSLLWILLTYFGIVRYVTIYTKSTESYRNNYKNLEKADLDNKVIISIVPSDNNKHLVNMVKSLLDQTVRVDEISLTLPYGSKYILPKELGNVVNMYRISKDYGASTKIVPVMLREGEKNTRIILLRDNIIYGKDFIEDLIENAKKNPESGVVFKNNLVLFESDFYSPKILENPPKDDKWMIENLAKKVTLKYSENYNAL